MRYLDLMTLIEDVQTLFSREFVPDELQWCTSRSTQRLLLLVSESDHSLRAELNQNEVVRRRGCGALCHDHECEPSVSTRGAFVRISPFLNLSRILNEKEAHVI